MLSTQQTGCAQDLRAFRENRTKTVNRFNLNEIYGSSRSRLYRGESLIREFCAFSTVSPNAEKLGTMAIAFEADLHRRFGLFDRFLPLYRFFVYFGTRILKENSW